MPELSHSPARAEAVRAGARVAAAVRHSPADRENLARLRREHAAAKIAAAIEAAVESAPPLTQEQVGALCALLVGDGSTVAGGAR